MPSAVPVCAKGRGRRIRAVIIARQTYAGIGRAHEVGLGLEFIARRGIDRVAAHAFGVGIGTTFEWKGRRIGGRAWQIRRPFVVFMSCQAFWGYLSKTGLFLCGWIGIIFLERGNSGTQRCPRRELGA